MAASRKKQSEAALVVALACGASPENAAQKAGVSVRTVYRRLNDPVFRAAVNDARADMVRRAAAMFSAAGIAALKTITMLQETATSEAVRLGAARAVIELGCKLRDQAELFERITALEKRLEGLLDSSRSAADV